MEECNILALQITSQTVVTPDRLANLCWWILKLVIVSRICCAMDLLWCDIDTDIVICGNKMVMFILPRNNKYENYVMILD